ncbi:uncharacterized protein LOC125827501 [Solanum verrucosum]|uniref:uncharacterized protein LOC125827501 n=1 Tax=Solanum verrucosum TaxID=315347 RepID=UPI0020D058A5|nr:uncharacterized protein LOC125827501 [Solanum verrucosum]
MEYLSRLLKGLKEETNFKYYPKHSKLDITHLCFADDLLIFSRGDLNSIKALQRFFSQFSQASGLQANLNKSSIYFGGVQLRGRTQLVQTVLFGVQSYWAQLFINPAKIIKLIEGHCKSYLWSGFGYVIKKALVAWERVCCPKSTGSMGLINMQI